MAKKAVSREENIYKKMSIDKKLLKFKVFLVKIPCNHTNSNVTLTMDMYMPVYVGYRMIFEDLIGNLLNWKKYQA